MQLTSATDTATYSRKGAFIPFSPRKVRSPAAKSALRLNLTNEMNRGTFLKTGSFLATISSQYP